MNTRIYCVFPACGKTWLSYHQKDFNLRILDCDSSQFSWVCVGGRRERNPNFPANYIAHIKQNIGKYDYIFVSTHAAVREVLDKEGIDFTIVYPNMRCKAEWVGRCFIREQNNENGCGAKVLLGNWEQWISDCINTGFDHAEIVLHHGEYLSKIL